jgi:hypothetical protein
MDQALSNFAVTTDRVDHVVLEYPRRSTFDSSKSHVRVAAACSHEQAAALLTVHSLFVQTIQFSRVPSGQVTRLAVGQERFELSTPRLSSVCSDQLSYWPNRPVVRSLKTDSERV